MPHGKKLLTEPVLVLNANFEPLNLASTKRALGLVLSGKAETIINGRGHIKTSSAKFEIPSIIRLSQMIKRPRPRVNLTKREILRRDNFTCQYCGTRSHHLTIDHIEPRHRGGGHHWTNVVAACAACNRRKGGRNPDQANMQLRRAPYEPSASAMYLYGRHLPTQPEWEQFLTGW